MSAGVYDTDIEPGAEWTRTLTWEDAAGAPVPMAGYTAKLQIRESVAEPVLVEITTENLGIVLGATNGSIALKISAAATAVLTGPHVYYDLKLFPPSSGPIRLLRGTLLVIPAVTR